VAQHITWAYERPNGGRGFGFTGGHYHQNWKEDNFGKLVLNALALDREINYSCRWNFVPYSQPKGFGAESGLPETETK
jgi:hypothetical protein